mgnify:CR=1 FL=1
MAFTSSFGRPFSVGSKVTIEDFPLHGFYECNNEPIDQVEVGQFKAQGKCDKLYLSFSSLLQKMQQKFVKYELVLKFYSNNCVIMQIIKLLLFSR